MSEMKFSVTDSAYKRSGIDYINKTLKKYVTSSGGRCETGELGGRCYFVANLSGERAKAFSDILEDKIADVVAVNYKYDYFKKYIRVAGLNSVEYELLLSALIAADLDDDKKYARTKLVGTTYAVDGSFNFTMKPLVDKWRDVAGYIPPYFSAERLKEFVTYIVSEKTGGRVYVVGGRVYDGNYNVLDRAFLTGGGDCRVIKELILSSSKEVELTAPIPETDEYYLKEFFGDGIFFGKGYFC